MIKILIVMMTMVMMIKILMSNKVLVQEYNSPPSPGTLADITMQELGQ